MEENKITWKQFEICCNDTQGIKHRFEDLCRQIFTYEFLSQNKKQKCLHSNPNNAGLETEPIFDELNNRWIGFQAKHFDNNVNYRQIENSVKQILKYYAGKVDYVYIYSNKSINVTCKSYIKIKTLLNEANISVEAITNTEILDIARKYSNLGMYYFGQHGISKTWLEYHNKNVLLRLGERYNEDFNVETQTAEKLSLFMEDEDAIQYLNSKKTRMIESIKKLHSRYDGFDDFKNKLIESVTVIPDVSFENMSDSIDWNNRIESIVGKDIAFFKKRLEQIEVEYDQLLISFQDKKHGNHKKSKDDISRLRTEKERYEQFIEISRGLKLTEEEIQLLNSKILIIEGKAGVGKSHLLAEKMNKIITYYQKSALMLLGGEYLDASSVMEQIRLGMNLKCSFLELLEILNFEGEKGNYKVPIFIDALNESWNKEIWKNGLPVIFKSIESLGNIKLIISFRSEYKSALIDDYVLKKEKIFVLTHRGFIGESIEVTKKFLDYYGIMFTPIHMFNQSITNPLFLTLYCKTYKGDEVDLPTLYERLLNNAYENIYKNMSQSLKNSGYEASDNVLIEFVLALANLINETGRKVFTKDDIRNLSFWKEYNIGMQPFVRNMIKENILCDMYDNGEKFYFSYDQMNDYFCAKKILSKFDSKDKLKKYMKENILQICDNKFINYQNQDLFICLCALFVERYGEECIDIIDDISNEYDRQYIFESYIDSLHWRKSYDLSVEKFLNLCNKYHPSLEKVWEMFIANSLKQKSIFNVHALHHILIEKPLYKRDYIWTMSYINQLQHYPENRLVQIIQLYSSGNGLEFQDDKQIEMLLILFAWVLTSSSRWLRDLTSKAIIEILKDKFDFSECLLKKFHKVNDPYIIQRLYGCVWGACVKKVDTNQSNYFSLAKYVYDEIFCAEKVYPDILLRDYARLIIERYKYEYPNENLFMETRLLPPYNSDPIPNIKDQKYLARNYKKGLYLLVSSMRFNFSGWYGDFGRYVFEAALRSFDVNLKDIFNYSIHYIINVLGYDNQLFGDYDTNMNRSYYYPNNNAKIERIGKKYQWIAMYNILARISDHYSKKDRYAVEEENQIYIGPWEPYVRDFDPSLNELFVSNEAVPKFEKINHNEEKFKERINQELNTSKFKKKWLNKYPDFFEYQQSNLVMQDTSGVEWIVLTKHDKIEISKTLNEELQIWNWIYGYFVSEDQRNILKKYNSEKIDLINSDITWIPQTYTIYCREYPWAKSCEYFNQLAYKSMKIKTDEKRIEEVTYPSFDFEEWEDYESDEDIEFDDIEMMDSDQRLALKSKYFKEKTEFREVDVEEGIGKILCASVDLLWEEELDASKKEAISWFAPCAELINTLNLQYGECDCSFYDEEEKLAAFDTRIINRNIGLVVRKDLFDLFLQIKGYCFVWFVKASNEIHGADYTIKKYSDWSGLLTYENGQIMGEAFCCENSEKS